MCNNTNIAILRKLTSKRLNVALVEIQAVSDNPAMKYCQTAEYLLTKAKEYVEGAWEMLASGKPDASIALSRWVLEAAANLCWVVADKDKIDDRLRDIVGEALRNEANLLEGKAKLWTEQAPALEERARKARATRTNLKAEELASLDNRLRDTKQDDCDFRELYPLYRICCAKAHPGLRAWEMFAVVNGTTVRREPVDDSPTARWMAAAPVFYLISSCYCLAGCGNTEELNDWWEKQVRPLLETEPDTKPPQGEAENQNKKGTGASKKTNSFLLTVAAIIFVTPFGVSGDGPVMDSFKSSFVFAIPWCLSGWLAIMIAQKIDGKICDWQTKLCSLLFGPAILIMVIITFTMEYFKKKIRAKYTPQELSCRKRDIFDYWDQICPWNESR
jgi:hypothetical protein